VIGRKVTVKRGAPATAATSTIASSGTFAPSVPSSPEPAERALRAGVGAMPARKPASSIEASLSVAN
jgi:hypothetical protein